MPYPRIPASVLFILLCLAAGNLSAQETEDHAKHGAAAADAHMMGHVYEMDPAHSQVGFKIRHLAVANVRGIFRDVETSIVLDPADVTTLATEATISVQSVDTGNENRDSDLRSDGFFDVEQFPEIRFASTGVSDVGDDGTFKLHGQLTIRDVTKDVVLDAEMLGPIAHRGSERIGFVATTRIDRFDYDLKWNAMTEAGGLIAGRDVDITIEIEARREVQ
jgi:polyisoprenoid-binding protein YceI